MIVGPPALGASGISKWARAVVIDDDQASADFGERRTVGDLAAERDRPGGLVAHADDFAWRHLRAARDADELDVAVGLGVSCRRTAAKHLRRDALGATAAACGGGAECASARRSSR